MYVEQSLFAANTTASAIKVPVAAKELPGAANPPKPYWKREVTEMTGDFKDPSKLSDEVIEYCLTHEDWYLRKAAVQTCRLTDEQKARATMDSTWSVRMAAVERNDLPEGMVMRLVQDSVVAVSEAAIRSKNV